MNSKSQTDFIVNIIKLLATGIIFIFAMTFITKAVGGGFLFNIKGQISNIVGAVNDASEGSGRITGINIPGEHIIFQVFGSGQCETALAGMQTHGYSNDNYAEICESKYCLCMAKLDMNYEAETDGIKGQGYSIRDYFNEEEDLLIYDSFLNLDIEDISNPINRYASVYTTEVRVSLFNMLTDISIINNVIKDSCSQILSNKDYFDFGESLLYCYPIENAEEVTKLEEIHFVSWDFGTKSSSDYSALIWLFSPNNYIIDYLFTIIGKEPMIGVYVIYK